MPSKVTVYCSFRPNESAAQPGWWIQKTIRWKLPFRLKKGDEVLFSGWDLKVDEMDSFDAEKGTCDLMVTSDYMSPIASLVKKHGWKMGGDDVEGYEEALAAWRKTLAENQRT